jgi:hypothetical protein
MLAVSFVTPPNTKAKKETPYQAGYDHGCNDAKLTLPNRYISQPGKGPNFHTQEFMSGYNAGLRVCSNKPSPIGSSSSILFKQGYAKGTMDAKSLSHSQASTMRPEDVDCDSDINPKASNVDYCSGYQHGFANTMNNNNDNNNKNTLSTTSTSTNGFPAAAKSSPSSAQVVAPPPKVCSDGSAPDANGKCSPVSQAPDQGATLSTTTTPLQDHDHKASNLGGSLSSSDNNNPAPPLSVENNNKNNNNINNDNNH